MAVRQEAAAAAAEPPARMPATPDTPRRMRFLCPRLPCEARAPSHDLKRASPVLTAHRRPVLNERITYLTTNGWRKALGTQFVTPASRLVQRAQTW